MEIYNINDREFKSVLLKTLNKMQENTDRQFYILRTQINDQNVQFTKDIGTLKNKVKQSPGWCG